MSSIRVSTPEPGASPPAFVVMAEQARALAAAWQVVEDDLVFNHLGHAIDSVTDYAVQAMRDWINAEAIAACRAAMA